MSDLAKMSPIDLLRLLLSQVVFNQMESNRVRIDLQIRRGHQLHHSLESLSNERERDAFDSYIYPEDCQALRVYREWLEDEDDRGRRLVSKVEDMLKEFCSTDGYITPTLILFKLLGFDTTGLSLEPYDQFSNIHQLLVCLAKMSDEISSTATFDLDFFKLLDKYKLAFGFLRECIVQRKFVITQQQHSRLADFLSERGIDLDDFFSNGGILIPGSPKFDEIFVRAMMDSSELSTLTEFDEWSGSYGVPLPVEWWIQLFRCWTIIHKRLSSDEQPLQELLTFLKEVLPHLKQTKNFLFESKLSDAMYGVLVNLYRKCQESSDAEIPQGLDDLLEFMQEWVTTMVFPESSGPHSIRDLLVERFAGIGLNSWEALCFSKSFEKMSPEEKALIERASALFQAPENSPNFRGPNIWNLGKEDQAAVSFYWKAKENASREASGMHASCVSPPLVPEMLLKLLMFLGFPSGLLNPADLPETIAAVMIHFHEQVRSPETREKMREVCNARFIYGVLEHLQIPESCVIDRINKNLVTNYLTITAFFEANFLDRV